MWCNLLSIYSSMPSSMEELTELISLPSCFQMELLCKTKSKKTSSGNKESQSLNFPVACSFNGLPRWEHRYHTGIHLISLIWEAEDKLEMKLSTALFLTECSCELINFNLSGFWFLAQCRQKWLPTSKVAMRIKSTLKPQQWSPKGK